MVQFTIRGFFVCIVSLWGVAQSRALTTGERMTDSTTTSLTTEALDSLPDSGLNLNNWSNQDQWNTDESFPPHETEIHFTVIDYDNGAGSSREADDSQLHFSQGTLARERDRRQGQTPNPHRIVRLHPLQAMTVAVKHHMKDGLDFYCQNAVVQTRQREAGVSSCYEFARQIATGSESFHYPDISQKYDNPTDIAEVMNNLTQGLWSYQQLLENISSLAMAAYCCQNEGCVFYKMCDIILTTGAEANLTSSVRFECQAQKKRSPIKHDLINLLFHGNCFTWEMTQMGVEITATDSVDIRPPVNPGADDIPLYTLGALYNGKKQAENTHASLSELCSQSALRNPAGETVEILCDCA